MAQDVSEMFGQIMDNPGFAKMLANPELAQILANPAFATMVQNLRQQMGKGEAGVPDMTMIMEKLPAMLSMLSGGNGSKETEQKAAEISKAESMGTPVAGTAPAADEATMLPQLFFRPEVRDKRNKLLSALKPYLSPARGAMIDRAMSAMQLGELLGTMGMSQQGEG